MKILLIPGLALYFLIGYFFSEVSKEDANNDEFDSFLWFMFWPLLLVISALTMVISAIIMVIAYIYYSFVKNFNRKGKRK